MVTPRQLLHALINKGLVSEVSLMTDQLLIEELSSRNLNYAVTGVLPQDCFVKVATSQDTAQSLRTEAAFLSWVSASPGAVLRDYVPMCLHFDLDAHLLVLEFIPVDGTPRSGTGRATAQRKLTSSLAAALGALHCTDVSSYVDAVPAERPWVLQLDAIHIDELNVLSPPASDLIKAVQSSNDALALLQALRAGWSTDTLVHSDLKTENVLRRAGKAVLVDWESVGRGDARWDVGCALAELMLPLVASGRGDQADWDTASQVKYLVAVFRSHYESALGRRWFMAQTILLAVSYAGARLLQAAVEMSQGQHAPTRRSLMTAQLGLNVLLRPQEAAVHVLGLEL